MSSRLQQSLGALTHIEFDVAHLYRMKAFLAESTQIRTGGSLSSSHLVRVKVQREWSGSILNSMKDGAPIAHWAVAGSSHPGHSVCD